MNSDGKGSAGAENSPLLFGTFFETALPLGAMCGRRYLNSGKDGHSKGLTGRMEGGSEGYAGPKMGRRGTLQTTVGPDCFVV